MLIGLPGAGDIPSVGLARLNETRIVALTNPGALTVSVAVCGPDGNAPGVAVTVIVGGTAFVLPVDGFAVSQGWSAVIVSVTAGVFAEAVNATVMLFAVPGRKKRGFWA